MNIYLVLLKEFINDIKVNTEVYENRKAYLLQ
jgi:hypothetical protein